MVWLDSDLYFVNPNWVPQTAARLDRFAVVQPFAWMTCARSDPLPLPAAAVCCCLRVCCVVALRRLLASLPHRPPTHPPFLPAPPLPPPPCRALSYLPANQSPYAYIPLLVDLPLGLGVGEVYHSAGFALRHLQPFTFRSSFILGHPGFA